MNLPESQIVKFIKEHHVLNLATVANNQPWCCSCFYAYIENEAAFIFTSDSKTRHIAEVLNNNKVAVSIVLETKIVGKIRGLQISGEVFLAEGNSLDLAKKAYLKRFPYAILMNTTFWILQPNFIKFTDNRLGFGKKLLWDRNSKQ